MKYQSQYVMVFQNDYNWNEEKQKAIGFQIGVASCNDRTGNWRVHPRPIIEFTEALRRLFLASYWGYCKPSQG